MGNRYNDEGYRSESGRDESYGNGSGDRGERGLTGGERGRSMYGSGNASWEDRDRDLRERSSESRAERTWDDRDRGWSGGARSGQGLEGSSRPDLDRGYGHDGSAGTYGDRGRSDGGSGDGYGGGMRASSEPLPRHPRGEVDYGGPSVYGIRTGVGGRGGYTPPRDYASANDRGRGGSPGSYSSGYGAPPAYGQTYGQGHGQRFEQTYGQGYAQTYGRASAGAQSYGGTQDRGWGELGERSYGGNRDDRGEGLGHRMMEGIKSVFRGKGPKGYKRSDERVREDVLDRLNHLSMHAEVDASEVEAAVQDGEVTLTGFVTERRWKHMMEDAAEGVMGVRDVHNQIRVRRDDESSRATTTSGTSTGSGTGTSSTTGGTAGMGGDGSRRPSTGVAQRS